MADTKPNNNLLVKFRKYHSWGGVALAGFIVVVCLTGIYLNHKDLFKGHHEPSRHATALLSTTIELGHVPVSFDSALAVARDHWGDAPLEKVELKDEHGTLIYKVKKAEGGSELLINSTTGDVTVKAGYSEGGTTNWGKLLLDVHTGKVAGLGGKLVIDMTALVIIALTLTGLYLWWVPLSRKRRSARQREAAAQRAQAERLEPVVAS